MNLYANANRGWFETNKQVRFNLGPLCEIIDFRHHFLKCIIKDKWLCVKHHGNPHVYS